MNEGKKPGGLDALFAQKLVVVNFGIEAFYDDLKKQDVKAVHVNWKPPAGGNKKLAGMLDLLK